MLEEKTLMLGETERQKEKGGGGGAEDEMVRQHHQLSGHESEQAPGESEGQRRLECHSPWGCEESDMTQQLNNNYYNFSGCALQNTTKYLMPFLMVLALIVQKLVNNSLYPIFTHTYSQISQKNCPHTLVTLSHLLVTLQPTPSGFHPLHSTVTSLGKNG